MKNKIYLISAASVFVIVFNILFFVLGGVEHPASVWLSYAWILCAYLLAVALQFLQPKSFSTHIFVYSTGFISLSYFVAEFIAGIIFIVLALESYAAALTVQLVLFAVYLVVLLISMHYNKRTAEDEIARGKEISFIKVSSSKIQLMMTLTDDEPLKKEMEKLYDLLHASPSKSSPDAKPTESLIMVSLDELADGLEDAAGALGTIKKITRLVNERNRLVSLG